jgi:DNA polymerase III sliding clamp (beta) subunit (PCNA family)
MEAYDPAEFPIFPLIGKTIGTIEAKSLSTMLSSVSFAVEKQTYRAGTMSNICLSCEGNKLEMVATDAHRLAVITGEAMLEDFSVLLPSNAGRLLGGLDGPIILAIETSEDRNNLLYLQAYGGGRRIAIQLGQGNFPKWKDVVPNDCDLPARVEMNGDELARIILSMVEGQENYEEPRVSLSLSSSGIEITSGKTSQHYTATVIGKIDIKFKSELLAEGLSFIGGLVTIAMSTPKKPVKITGNSAKHGFFKGTRQERMYVLMPWGDE